MKKAGLPNLSELRVDARFYRRFIWMDMNFYRQVDRELMDLAAAETCRTESRKARKMK